MWGMYANMIAQILSQICSHIYIYYHRKIVRVATNELVVAEHTTSVIRESFTNSSISKNIERTCKESSGSFDTDDEISDSTTIDTIDDVVMLCRYNFSRSHRNNNENELLVLKK